MRDFLTALSLLLIGVGSALVFASPLIARRRLARRMLPDSSGEVLRPELLQKNSPDFLRENLRLKLYGLGVLLPGFILVLVLFAGKK